MSTPISLYSFAMKYRLRRQPFFSLFLFGILLCSSCGYRFGETRDAVFKEANAFFIPNFYNETYEMEAGEFFTKAFRESFQGKRGIRVLPLRERADWVIEGRVVKAYDAPAATRDIQSEHRIGAYEISCEVHITVWKRGDTPYIKDTLMTRVAYLGSGEAETLRQNRQVALRKAAETIAEKAYYRIMEGF